MRCHYDVLSLPRTAEDAEIKKAYRKLALQYHPDKNPDNVEEVMELFREVQSAYDVLSDPQERAFYDKHREEILKGGADYIDDALDLMHYFNPSIYSGFGDDHKGFYSVFTNAFCKLAEEEEQHMDDVEIFPEFGRSDSDYETVVRPFYVYWLSFRTKKSFVWKQVYDIRQAANRPTQRLMEKENKKLRETCRKKRNEEIRALVTYVRKRDKRVQAEIQRMKLKQEEQQRKAKEIQEMQKKDRSKILENYEEQEWMAFDDSKLDNIDSHFDDMFGSTAVNYDSDEEDYENILYCIACDKNFKSDKALANHEKSKKHKENVELIKNELEADLFEELHISNPDGDVIDEIDGKLSDHISEDIEDENYDSDSALPRLSSINLPANVVKRNVIDKASKSGEDYSMAKSKKSKKKKKKKGVILLDISEDSDDDDVLVDKEVTVEKTLDDNENNSPNETENNSRNETENYSQDEMEQVVNNIDNTEGEEIVNEESCVKVNGTESICEDENGEIDISEKSNEKKDFPKNKSKKNKKNNQVEEVTGSFECEICPKVFPTRNKLFAHIKAEGHASLKEGTRTSKKSKGKAKKK